MTNTFTTLPNEFGETLEIVQKLANGNIILFPTDTIWGIGCNATDTTAVKKIYQLKQRTPEKPYVLLVSDLDMLKNYVVQVPPKIETLLTHHIRPLSVVYPQGKNLPNIATAKDGSVAIRIVQDDFCKKIIQTLGKPLVATSANISGQPFPGNFQAIEQRIISGVDYVTTYRQEEDKLNNPSVLISINAKGDLIFLRK